MPFEYAIWQYVYLAVVAAVLMAFAVVIIRLILAATRALNAYADDRKLRTALALDELDGVHDPQSAGDAPQLR